MDIICREPTVFPRNPPDSNRRRLIRRTEPNLPPHITRSITWVAQETNRGYNLALHNAADNTIYNFPVEFIQGHWYTLIRHPMIPDEYYVYDDGILAHRQFGTRFPLRDNPYNPDYEPFHITLTPAVTTQVLFSIPEQTEGAGPSNIPHTPSVWSADLHTPRESQPAESSKEGDATEEADSEGSPEHPHTPEEADPHTYHPQVPEGHEQLSALPEIQQIKKELEQLNINIITAHHLPPILQVLPPDPSQFLAPPAPQVVPIFMANIQQQQQPPPQKPAPQPPEGGPPPAAGAQAQAAQPPAPPANGKWNGTPPEIFTGDWSKSNKFLQEFWLYRILNEENETMISPYKQAALTLCHHRSPWHAKSITVVLHLLDICRK